MVVRLYYASVHLPVLVLKAYLTAVYHQQTESLKNPYFPVTKKKKDEVLHDDFAIVVHSDNGYVRHALNKHG